MKNSKSGKEILLTLQVVLPKHMKQRENLKTLIDEENLPAVGDVLSKRKLKK